jgi:hypothetical protein
MATRTQKETPRISGEELAGTVRITGVINDSEFWAEGEASGNPSTGEYKVHLDYKSVPPGWDPLMYTDVKVSLLFLKEEGKAQNFLRLANGNYTSAGTIDLGDGNVLRNNTRISLLDKRTFVAVYVMYGTAHTGELSSMEFFEETLLPFGKGRIAALGLARWKRPDGTDLDAMFSTQYYLENGSQLAHPQVRRIEAKPNFQEGRFASTYVGKVRLLPRIIEEGGPYIGHLIA